MIPQGYPLKVQVTPIDGEGKPQDPDGSWPAMVIGWVASDPLEFGEGVYLPVVIGLEYGRYDYAIGQTLGREYAWQVIE